MTIDKKIIDRLKTNVTKYMFLGDEERDVLRLIGRDNCEYMLFEGGGYRWVWCNPALGSFCPGDTYRIKPSFVSMDEFPQSPAEDNNSRWLREMCEDWKLDADDFDLSRRLAISTLCCDLERKANNLASEIKQMKEERASDGFERGLGGCNYGDETW